jgi:hypothetical protein
MCDVIIARITLRGVHPLRVFICRMCMRCYSACDGDVEMGHVYMYDDNADDDENDNDFALMSTVARCQFIIVCEHGR